MPAEPTEDTIAPGLARWERHATVAHLQLDDAARLNALSVALVDSTLRALDEIEGEDSLRALVLSGAGRAFSAGGDLADVGARVQGGEPWPRLDVMRRLQRLVARLRDSRLPIVAAVSGPAYGAGWSVVLACDLVVAATDARFCQIFVRRDLVPDLGSAWLLPRAVGTLKAKEMMLLGDEWSAQAAYELGLINRLVATREEAEREALAIAARMAGTAPATMAMTKDLINRGPALPFEDLLKLEQHAQAIALGTPETLRAMADFLERRGANRAR
jgi:2-(1,2-epoxy-1,2-dihydrophenyl)acetyl-CoA isomerase